MFTKGYSRQVGLHNWEPSGFATGEAIRRGKKELQVSAGRCEGLPPASAPVTAAALPGSGAAPAAGTL